MVDMSADHTQSGVAHPLDKANGSGKWFLPLIAVVLLGSGLSLSR